MITRSLAAGLLVAAVAAVSSPAFSQRTATYPEGSIFTQPQQASPNTAARPAQPAPAEARIIPLDVPDAGNVRRPTNRDAGNLPVQRWQVDEDRREALTNSPK
jgi:hypothetical protein